jgi:hypothetical protein
MVRNEIHQSRDYPHADAGSRRQAGSLEPLARLLPEPLGSVTAHSRSPPGEFLQWQDPMEAHDTRRRSQWN